MSHFTRCSVRLTNRDAIRAALVDMAYPFDEAAPGQTVRSIGGCGEMRRGVFSVHMTGGDVAIMVGPDGMFEVHWPGVGGGTSERPIGGAEYACLLAQRYQYHNVRLACEDKGYAVAEEVDEADGSIRLLVRRWSADEQAGG